MIWLVVLLSAAPVPSCIHYIGQPCTTRRQARTGGIMREHRAATASTRSQYAATEGRHLRRHRYSYWSRARVSDVRLGQHVLVSPSCRSPPFNSVVPQRFLLNRY